VEPDSFHVGPPGAVSALRTFLVFLDLPKHVEFRVEGWPLLEEGTVVNFDLQVKERPDSRKPRDVVGPYRVKRRVLRFSTGRPSRSGLSQYLEMEPSGEVQPP
jgi:hypothetical protein